MTELLRIRRPALVVVFSLPSFSYDGNAPLNAPPVDALRVSSVVISESGLNVMSVAARL